MIVGAAKAGTSSLWTYLNSHPDVFMAKPKEPNYYVDGFGVGSEAAYGRLFKQARPGQHRGEASTSYLYIPSVAQRIAADLGPDAQVVIMLRDPIRTAYSLWAYNTAIGREQLPLADALAAESRRLRGEDSRVNRTLPNPTVLAYKGRVRYAEQVERYLDLFHNVHVAFFEEFFAEPEEAYCELCRFLGLSCHQASFDQVNRGGIPRSRASQILLSATSPGRNHWWSSAVRTAVPKAWRARARTLQSALRPRLFTETPPIDAASADTIRIAVSDDVEHLEALLGRPVPAAWNDYPPAEAGR